MLQGYEIKTHHKPITNNYALICRQSGPPLLWFHILFAKASLAPLHRGLLATSGLVLPDLSGFLLIQALNILMLSINLTLS